MNVSKNRKTITHNNLYGNTRSLNLPTYYFMYETPNDFVVCSKYQYPIINGAPHVDNTKNIIYPTNLPVTRAIILVEPQRTVCALDLLNEHNLG